MKRHPEGVKLDSDTKVKTILPQEAVKRLESIANQRAESMDELLASIVEKGLRNPEVYLNPGFKENLKRACCRAWRRLSAFLL